MTIFLLPLAFVALFIFLLRQSGSLQVPGLSGRYLQLLFLIKSFTGIFITYIGIHFLEPTDMVGFFHSGQKFFQLLKSDPGLFVRVFIGFEDQSAESFLNTIGGWYVYVWDAGLNDNRIIIRINALISFLSNGNIYVHSVFFSFLSTLGMILLLKSVSKIINNRNLIHAVIALTFLPGLLCWTSIISKESLVIFLIGALFYSFNLFLKNPKNHLNTFLLLLTLLTFSFSRVYVLLLLLPSLIAWAYCHFRRVKKSGLVFLIVHLVSISSLIIAGEMNPKYNPTWIIYQRQMTFMQYTAEVQPDTKISLPAPAYTYSNLIQRIPGAFFNSLIHPGFHELKNIFLIPFFLENIMLILFLLFLVYRIRSVKDSPLNWTALWFFAGLFILIGLTIPMSGLLIRLRVPALLMIIFPLAQIFTKAGNLPDPQAEKRN